MYQALIWLNNIRKGSICPIPHFMRLFLTNMIPVGTGLHSLVCGEWIQLLTWNIDDTSENCYPYHHSSLIHHNLFIIHPHYHQKVNEYDVIIIFITRIMFSSFVLSFEMMHATSCYWIVRRHGKPNASSNFVFFRPNANLQISSN